jgi:hypothetical protein
MGQGNLGAPGKTQWQFGPGIAARSMRICAIPRSHAETCWLGGPCHWAICPPLRFGGTHGAYDFSGWGDFIADIMAVIVLGAALAWGTRESREPAAEG